MTSLDSTRNYLGHSIATIHAHISNRTLSNSVAYLVPVLDSLPPDFTFLDVGCGPASITIDIARRYPSAVILAIDGSSSVIAHAQDSAREAKVDNIHFAVGDALDLTSTASEPGFELVDGGCDIAHTHNVLMHTTDAPRALRELRSAVKVGGFVCCKEADRNCLTLWPESLPIRRIYDVISRIMQAKGGDPFVGRKLKTYAIAAGFEHDDIRVGQTPWVISSRNEREQWGGLVARTSADTHARVQVEEEARGIGQDINMAELQEGWRRWIEDDRSCASISDFYVVCKRR
ncbi:methyltransferase domain-containing protein [Colletotrichum graminicola]|uniref:Methyltransferase domain-containing protein n=1 Tax=Colletotrichum graminicola (strain M1.001 / M2 / FGSC 10212) TaxID=645133 RepID=E3R0U9_COLGM|nr:methyltransferase domain-containing protein [Colletotrichum graminicola M1.001]EFQ36737.1 methyltransferase domain-containing protein [Colletotrichum graminicola M1.001]WDK22870.1 methyltransferase domain-containing protein [Colletotrichum graminicola]